MHGLATRLHDPESTPAKMDTAFFFEWQQTFVGTRCRVVCEEEPKGLMWPACKDVYFYHARNNVDMMSTEVHATVSVYPIDYSRIHFKPYLAEIEWKFRIRQVTQSSDDDASAHAFWYKRSDQWITNVPKHLWSMFCNPLLSPLSTCRPTTPALHGVNVKRVALCSWWFLFWKKK